jgi:hypothetical protein
VIEAYSIGITLALNDEVSAGIASIRENLKALEGDVEKGGAGLRSLCELGRAIDLPTTPQVQHVAESSTLFSTFAPQPLKVETTSRLDQSTEEALLATADPYNVDPAQSPFPPDLNSTQPPTTELVSLAPRTELATTSIEPAHEDRVFSPLPLVEPTVKYPSAAAVPEPSPTIPELERFVLFGRNVSFPSGGLPTSDSVVRGGFSKASQPDMHYAKTGADNYASVVYQPAGKSDGHYAETGADDYASVAYQPSGKSAAEAKARTNPPLDHELGWLSERPGPPPTSSSRLAAPAALEKRDAPVPSNISIAPQQMRLQSQSSELGQNPAASPPTGGDSRPGVGGSLYMDGAQIGRWILDRIADRASRPVSGYSGFDPKLTPSFPGALFST